MAYYMSSKEMIEKGYITDVSIATKLLAGELDPDDDLVKDHFHQVGDYPKAYVGPADDPKTDENENTEAASAAESKVFEDMSKDDHDSTNDIIFTVDGAEVKWEGSPKTKAMNALKKLGYENVYEGEVLVKDVESIKTTKDLAGRTFTQTAPNAENAE